MAVGMLIAQIVCFGFVFWLGLYMMYRDVKNRRMLLAGIALLVEASCLAASIFLPYAADGNTIFFLSKWYDIAFLVPFAIAQGVLLLVLANHVKRRGQLLAVWMYGILPVVLLGCLFLLFAASGYTYGRVGLMAICLLPCFVLLLWGAYRDRKQRQELGRLPFLAALFLSACFALWMAGIPDGWLKAVLLIVQSLLLFLVGVALTAAEIKAQGEAWLPDFFRSLDYSIFYAFLYGGLVGLAIAWGPGLEFAMVALLLAMLSLSIALQVFIHPLRTLLDNIAYVTFPKLREDSSRRRMVDRVTLFVDEAAGQQELDEETLYRYTRRALSHFGDLERLAANPLTRLKLIEARLQIRNAPDEVIERAVELKAVLTESIEQLKPRQNEQFGTSDEWRYYNALYYPCIAGIKPYNRRYSDELLDGPVQEALEWFRTYVPERTFYNWQNAGARLVAMQLKNMNYL